MDVQRIGEAGLTGLRGRVLTPILGSISKLTPFEERSLRAVVGGVFLLLAARTLVAAGREARRPA
jgi:hypothetical protein